MTDPASAKFASPVDESAHGIYTIRQQPGERRPLYRFDGRITADGSSGAAAERGRYHVYAGWFCPWSQRVTIQVALNGLDRVIGVSYVDDERDGRGWAFRAEHGTDPINGFTLPRQAYEVTEPGFDGHISTPTLWDRSTARVLSNTYNTIGIDIATEFGAFAAGPADSYAEANREEIEELDRWLGPAVNQGVALAAQATAAGREARSALLEAFETLDVRLARRRYLLGERITEADVRLFVTLVRYDTGPNARRAINPGLSEFANLWAYARDLYSHPAFSSTTRFASFTTPGTPIPDWTQPTDRAQLGERVSPGGGIKR